MQEFIFVNAQGIRTGITADMTDNTIRIDDGSPFADFTDGHFEKKLADGTQEKYRVTTWQIVIYPDGFGMGYVITVETP